MSTIETIIRRVLGADKVEAVRITREVNPDGMSVDRILVILADQQPPSVEEMRSVVDELWSQAAHDPDFAMPVTTFRSTEDQKGLAAA